MAFLAGLLIFPLAFHLGDAKVTTSEGPGLVFVVLPAVFKSMGNLQGVLLGSCFFLSLVLAGVTSAISQLEIPTKYVMERFGLSRRMSVIMVTVICYLLGIPSLMGCGGSVFFTEFLKVGDRVYSFMDVIIEVLTAYIMPLVALFFCLFISRYWDDEEMTKEIDLPKVYGDFFMRYIRFCITYVAPILILAVMLMPFVL